MKPYDHSKRGHIPAPPPHSDHTGAIILALLAAAAFCGWYLTVIDSLTGTEPLPVVQKPIMPPATTDLSADLPGHTHYTILVPGTGQSHTAKSP
jgi:hypothetical protein